MALSGRSSLDDHERGQGQGGETERDHDAAAQIRVGEQTGIIAEPDRFARDDAIPFQGADAKHLHQRVQHEQPERQHGGHHTPPARGEPAFGLSKRWVLVRCWIQNRNLRPRLPVREPSVE
jgi:hypothetical protein